LTLCHRIFFRMVVNHTQLFSPAFASVIIIIIFFIICIIFLPLSAFTKDDFIPSDIYKTF
jgi:hypothetical protein